MIIYNIKDTKSFMNAMFKKDSFDRFEVRDVFITTFTSFEIHCKYNSKFFSLDASVEAANKKWCAWEEIKPYAFSIIKGSRTPALVKVIFSADESLIEEISPQAASMFINVIFEKGNLTVSTGYSQKNFSLDKSAEVCWDEYVSGFLSENGLEFEEPKYEDTDYGEGEIEEDEYK